MSDRGPLVITIDEREWDLAASEQFAQLLAPACDRPNVIIDMSRVEYIDSSCLGKLAALRKARKPSAPQARLVVASPNVLRVLKIVGFDRLWPIFSSLDEALLDAGGLEEA